MNKILSPIAIMAASLLILMAGKILYQDTTINNIIGSLGISFAYIIFAVIFASNHIELGLFAALLIIIGTLMTYRYSRKCVATQKINELANVPLYTSILTFSGVLLLILLYSYNSGAFNIYSFMSAAILVFILLLTRVASQMYQTDFHDILYIISMFSLILLT